MNTVVFPEDIANAVQSAYLQTEDEDARNLLLFVGAELLDPFVILGGEVFGAVYHLVEIILHDSHILSLRVQWHVCML